VKFREIFRFEIAYQARRASTWLSFVVLFVFAFRVMGGSRPTDGDELLFSPFGIAFFTVLGGAIWLLLAASVAGEAATRDVQTRMHPLIYTAAIGKAEYLGGRFLAAFVLNSLILLAVPAGVLLALLFFDVEPSRLAPFRPASYLTAYGFIALPFAFVATAIQFSWATLNRRPMASHLASVLLVTSTFVLLTLGQRLGSWELVRLLDLVGVGGIIVNLGETWTATQKNTRLVGMEGTLLANRAIWLAIAAGALAFTYLRFRLAHPAESARPTFVRRRRDAPPAIVAVGRIASTTVAMPRVRQAFGISTSLRQTLGIAWTSFRAIAKSWSGLVLLAAIPLLLALAVSNDMDLMGVPLLPRTDYVLAYLTAPLTDPFTPWVIVPLLIILCAGELVWRERDAGLDAFTDAAPVPLWALFLGKLLGLGLVLVVFMTLLTVAGVLVQIRLGHFDFDVGLSLQILFGLQLPEYLLFAVLALVVQGLASQKYAGYLAALVAYGFIAFASSLGLEHNLLVYGSSPEWSYTEMSGFGPSLGAWLWFKLYWAAWALLLAVVAVMFWVRGREASLGARLQRARRRFTLPLSGMAAMAVGLILTLGGSIFYNTNVLNEYVTASDWIERRAEYERRYGRYDRIAQPRLTGIDLHVDIHPDRGAVEIRGTYHLVNGGAVSIDSIHVATAPDAETGAVTFDRAAALVLADAELSHRIYALARPLQPGDSLRLGFEVHSEPRGFRNSGVDASVVANGTYFGGEAMLPAIGYQPGRELMNAGDRRAHGLPPRPGFRSLDDVEARQDSTGKQRIAFEAVVGTDADQIAVAPGTLRATWTEGSRRYFRYATDAPISSEFAFFSARYVVRDERWNDVAIRIHHDPRHTANLDHMLRSVRASLDYYTEQFGPYPYRHLTLVERPGVGGMSAPSSLIIFQEGFSLFRLEGDSRVPHSPFAVVAHEVAHQWWGSHLTPARVEGTPLLSESLAEYSALQVVKKTYGPEHLRRYLALLRARYGDRGKRADVPLLRASDHFHQYTKGPLAMFAVSEYIGEDRVNRALRRLLDAHGSGARPLLTTLDLYRELHAVTPDSLQYLLHDLFQANTFWELETVAATAVQTGGGAWQVTLDVRARKTTIDKAGVETEVPMNDWVEVAVFAPFEESEASGRPLYLQKHRIRSGEQTIRVMVPREPARAGIDPHHLLIDLESDDNVERVKIERRTR
jgi:ABC-2 type transport system permease protein